MIEKAFVNLFQHQIRFNNDFIPVLRRYKAIDKTPCLTVRKAVEIEEDRQYIHDPLEKLRYRLNNAVWVDIWCNTEEERYYLREEVNKIIDAAMRNHYRYCANFKHEKDGKGVCSYNNDVCMISRLSHRDFDLHFRKAQCLTPRKNNYISFFKANNILKSTFRKSGELQLDELNFKPPLLRTQLQFTFERFKYVDVGGYVFNSVEIDL